MWKLSWDSGYVVRQIGKLSNIKIGYQPFTYLLDNIRIGYDNILSFSGETNLSISELNHLRDVRSGRFWDKLEVSLEWRVPQLVGDGCSCSSISCKKRKLDQNFGLRILNTFCYNNSMCLSQILQQSGRNNNRLTSWTSSVLVLSTKDN